ncbi:hypothetical protein K435DRAFT_785668 [Dendrothele bispora CBS 962.96]|uniref:Uncharacterized protein n=1 Tax=Dendrothele bispora (strain CBS 962.96) TaxID=1314807 RepID=A0A4S8KVE2_DENBC|nr:hypothetical protein K435DRAFT_785668 [Dendrothele bispora CBS 962.96]
MHEEPIHTRASRSLPGASFEPLAARTDPQSRKSPLSCHVLRHVIVPDVGCLPFPPI